MNSLALAVLATATLMSTGLTPSEAVAASRRDSDTIPVEIRPYIRYLSMVEVPDSSRVEVAAVLSGHINSLSRESDRTPLTRIYVNGQMVALRLSLKDYGIATKVWEDLAKVDPYYHVQLVVDWEGGVWPYDGPDKGKTFKKGEFPYLKPAIAPWLAYDKQSADDITALVAATQSSVPIVRADWFFNETASAVDRNPGYYEFLGIAKLDDFHKLIGFDPKRHRLKIEIRDAVKKSGVANQARGIFRFDTDEGGFFWGTLDVRKATDRTNPLRVLGRDFEKFWKESNKNDAAQELIATLPNDMLVYALFNNAGEKQASAPDFVGGDKFTHSNDSRIHNPVSCLRCHDDRGLKPIVPYIRQTFVPPLKLDNNAGYESARIDKQLFGRGLESFLLRDKEQYERAVIESTGGVQFGLSAKKYHAAYAALWHRTEDASYNLAGAAADLCVSTEQLKTALELAVKTRALGAQDPSRADIVLSSLLQSVNGVPETLDKTQWQEVYGLARSTLHTYAGRN